MSGARLGDAGGQMKEGAAQVSWRRQDSEEPE